MVTLTPRAACFQLATQDRRTLSTYTYAKSAAGLRVSISAMAASISHSIAHNTASVIIGARPRRNERTTAPRVVQRSQRKINVSLRGPGGSANNRPLAEVQGGRVRRNPTDDVFATSAL